jgi:hypothetical protein
LKYLGAMAICTLAIILTVIILSTDNASEGFGAVETVAERKPGDFKNVKTNSDRVAFIESYGWSVDAAPIDSAEVVIPELFDEVFNKYNEIQKSEGLDLSKYKGKSVRKYTYTVKNCDFDGTVYANLLVYKNKVIGGDICTASSKGFIQGFTKK